MDKHTELLARGYTAEEAELVLHVTETAEAERERAHATGKCACGGSLTRNHGAIECLVCDNVIAA